MTLLPPNLIDVFANISPADQEKITTGWSHPRSIVSFRVNNLRSSRAEVIEALGKAGLPCSIWTYSEDAFHMDKEHEYALRGLEIYKTGKIYVQSLSSMIPALCLDLQPGQTILDMAAAPGSKTTQIASMLGGKCKVVALEKFGVRLEKLVHTIKSQGAEKCVEVIKIDATEIGKLLLKGAVEGRDGGFSDAEKSLNGIITSPSPFKKGAYDCILLDVPCSSDGRINLSDEKTYCWYSGEKSRSKSILQYEMLEQARKLLKDTGKIVYSTCSVSRRENEDVIQKFLKTHPEFTLLPSPIAPDYTLEDNMNRWYPSTMMEGFFVAILERK